MADNPVVGILPAAGCSERFGEDKLLYPLPGGTPIVGVVAEKLLRVVPRVIAVVRPEARRTARLLESLGAQVVENPDYRLGMGSSLSSAVNVSSDAGGWIVALGDMPFIKVSTIRSVYDALRETGALLVVPVFRESRGHPVGFNRTFGERLRRLPPEQGARSLVDRHQANLLEIDVEDPGILWDIDRKEDLRRAELYPKWGEK